MEKQTEQGWEGLSPLSWKVLGSLGKFLSLATHKSQRSNPRPASAQGTLLAPCSSASQVL